MNSDYSTLYVIANGFDLHHSLPTKYCDFHFFLKKEYPSLEKTFEQYFYLKLDENYLWKSFESDLNSFDDSSFFKNNCDWTPMEEGFKSSQVFCVEDSLEQESEELVSGLKEAFFNWVESIIIDDIKANYVFQNNSFFITFNYTMLLEEVYNISTERILHIHGSVKKDYDNLVFGHGTEYKEEEMLDENGEPTRTIFSDAIGKSKSPLYNLQKKVLDIISENLERFQTFNGINEIFILGHSFGEVDMPYFEKIFFYTKDAFWHVSFYNDDEGIEFKSKLQSIGIKENKIRMFKM